MAVFHRAHGAGAAPSRLPGYKLQTALWHKLQIIDDKLQTALQYKLQIIDGRSNEANKEIIIAVYWFTNRELFDALVAKLQNGVNIHLIIHNDFINNRESGLPFQEFIDNGGKFYFSDGNNPMHNKFCIIDQKILINGAIHVNPL